LGAPHVDDESSPLDPPEFAKLRPEGVVLPAFALHRAHDRYPRRMCFLLPSTERRGKGTGQRGQQKAATVHYSIT